MNDVTNHRIMWLLIVQGLIANAAVSAGRENTGVVSMMAALLVALQLSLLCLTWVWWQARNEEEAHLQK